MKNNYDIRNGLMKSDEASSVNPLSLPLSGTAQSYAASSP